MEERDSKFIFFLFILVFYGCGYRCTNRPYSFSKIVILLRKELIAGTLEIYERSKFFERNFTKNLNPIMALPIIIAVRWFFRAFGFIDCFARL